MGNFPVCVLLQIMWERGGAGCWRGFHLLKRLKVINISHLLALKLNLCKLPCRLSKVKNFKQAGAELGRAQLKLELGSTSTNLH